MGATPPPQISSKTVESRAGIFRWELWWPRKEQQVQTAAAGSERYESSKRRLPLWLTLKSRRWSPGRVWVGELRVTAAELFPVVTNFPARCKPPLSFCAGLLPSPLPLRTPSSCKAHWSLPTVPALIPSATPASRHLGLVLSLSPNTGCSAVRAASRAGSRLQQLHRTFLTRYQARGQVVFSDSLSCCLHLLQNRRVYRQKRLLSPAPIPVAAAPPHLRGGPPVTFEPPSFSVRVERDPK